MKKWKHILDKNVYGGVVLVALSKALNTLNQNLLIARLKTYGFTRESLKLVKSCLTNRWQ